MNFSILFGVIFINIRSLIHNSGGSTTANISFIVQTAAEQLVTQNKNGFGGSGAQVDTSPTSSFVLFQNDWTSNATNRDGTANVKQEGINNTYSNGAYRDPFANNALKFFVLDRNNNRVLIFNSMPCLSYSEFALLSKFNKFWH